MYGVRREGMIENSGKYYLYRHIRLDKNEPFYIGIGTKKHPDIDKNSNYERSYISHKQNNIWHKISKKTVYIVEILLESNDYDFIESKEIEFIKLYGRINLGTGILANLTDGGGGRHGMSLEEKQYRSRKVSGSGHPRYNKHCENITKERIGKANGGSNNGMFGKYGGNNPTSKQVYVYHLNGEYYKSFTSAREAGKELNMNYKTISEYAILDRINSRKFVYLFSFSKFNNIIERV